MRSRWIVLLSNNSIQQHRIETDNVCDKHEAEWSTAHLVWSAIGGLRENHLQKSNEDGMNLSNFHANS